MGCTRTSIGAGSPRVVPSGVRNVAVSRVSPRVIDRASKETEARLSAPMLTGSG
nr:hypothetical protein [Serinicoccus sp. CUA-874]